MKRYYAIDWDLMHELDLSPNEWVFLENIHFLQAQTGVAFAKKKTLAQHMRMTTRGIQKMTQRLIENGYLEEVEHNGLPGLRATQKWTNPNQTKEANSVPMQHSSDEANSVPMQHSSDEANSVPKEANSVPKEANSVPPLTIKKEIKGDIKREKGTPKEGKVKKFSFRLGKKTQYANLSEEYQDALHAFAITIDQAGCLQNLIDYAEANGKGYSDWTAAYRQWVRRQVEWGKDVDSPRKVTTTSGRELWIDYTDGYGTDDGKTLIPLRRVVREPEPINPDGEADLFPEMPSEAQESKNTPEVGDGMDKVQKMLRNATEGLRF